MQNPTLMFWFVSLVGLALLTPPAAVAADTLDCAKKSLADAVAGVKEKDAVIAFTGVCTGPIVITADGVVLEGVGTAVIDGAGQNAVTIAGASRVSLEGIEVRNGLNGILASNGAHLSLTDVNVHDNALIGISLQTGSSAVLSGVITADNGLHGLDVQTGSSAKVTGTFSAADNQVFGIFVNGSAITFSTATVTASGNVLGIQIATNASAFINDPDTVLNATDNLSTGLTIVSGAHLVSFGGTINASNNLVAGVTVNSKAGLDLDAASTLNTFNNGDGLRVQQDSVMTVFNTPQFSGAQGKSTINAHDNTGRGVRVLTGSTLTLVNQAQVLSTGNGSSGLVVDNGAGVTLVGSTVTGNTGADILLTFGARLDVQLPLVVGTLTCDSTVLVRGITCP